MNDFDFSQDVDEHDGSDENQEHLIADKMVKGEGYEFKFHKNSEAMNKKISNINLIKKNNFLLNLNMNSGDP